MNWFDIALLLLIAVSIVSGFKKGFVRLGIGFVAMVIGFLLATWCYGLAGEWFVGYVHSRAMANLLGFIFVFSAVLLLGALVSFVISRALRMIGLGMVDRVGGAAMGAVQGALVGVVITMALLAFLPKPPAAIVHSRTAPYLVGSAHLLSRLAPLEVQDGMAKAMFELRRMWREIVGRKNAKIKTEEI